MTGVHRRYEVGVLVVVLAIASLGVVGLVAAILGVAEPVVVLPVATLVAAALIALWGRGDVARASAGGRSVPPIAIVLGLLVILFSGVFHARHNGQYIRTDRDPGIYTAGGLWIAEHGDLHVDGLVGGFDESQDLTGFVSGQWPIDDDPSKLEIQAQHLFPVLLASGKWVGGFTGYQLVPALIGSAGLAVFLALCLRFVHWGLALVATGGLAANFVFLYGIRSNLSEPTSLLFAMAGVWLLSRAVRDGSTRRFLVAGIVSGAALCTRIDGGVGIVALPVVVAVCGIVAERRDGSRVAWRWWGSFVAGLAALFMIARVDLYERSSFYAFHQGDKIRLVQLALVAGVVASVAVIVLGRLWLSGRFSRLADRLRDQRPRVATVAVLSVLLLFLLLWFVRPLLGPARSPMNEGGIPVMEAIQRQEGVEVDATRSFDEVSMERLTWYLGATTVGLAVAGLAVLTHRMVTRPDGERSMILLAAIAPTLLLYVWRPSIFPDQPWMMRRYLPIVIPGLLLAAVVAVEALHRLLAGRITDDGGRRWLDGSIAAVAVGIVVLAPLRVTLPLSDLRWMPGGYHGMTRLCDELGPDAAVVFSNSEMLATTLIPSFRGICDVPAARPAQQPFVDPLPIDDIRDALRAEGRQLWIIGPTPESIEQTAPQADPPAHLEIVEWDALRSTMFFPPARTEETRIELWYAPVPDAAVDTTEPDVGP